MTIHERAAVALARARAAGAAASLVDTAHQRRLRAAMIRDVAALLGVSPEHVLVTDDPVRAYGSMPGQLMRRAVQNRAVTAIQRQLDGIAQARGPHGGLTAVGLVAPTPTAATSATSQNVGAVTGSSQWGARGDDATPLTLSVGSSLAKPVALAH